MTTIYRLAEQIQRIINGGDVPVESKVEIEELKIHIGQVINSLLKADYLSVNLSLSELIPNGTMMGLYENIPVIKWGKTSASKLPIKPVKLPRNMGVWSIFKADDPNCQYIPLQMGESSLLNDQPLICDLLGQVGFETYGDQVVYTKDLTEEGQDVVVSMRLAIMDISQYSDYDPLPILPEMEAAVIEGVLKVYGTPAPSDKLVDGTNNEQRGPINTQIQP